MYLKTLWWRIYILCTNGGRNYNRPAGLPCRPEVAALKITKTLVQSMLEYSKDTYPNEMLLLLRAKRSGGDYVLYQAVFAPFMFSGPHSATYNPYHLPVDLSIVATAHSHPSGVKIPSHEDLLHPYGRYMLIVGFPFRGSEDIAAFDGKGHAVGWELADEED